MGYSIIKRIYVFEYNGRYKIGMTNCIKKRLSQLSCGCPGIKCVYESDLLRNAPAIEKNIHRKMSSYCVGGEWFECDLNELLRILSPIIEKDGKKVSIGCYKNERETELRKCENSTKILLNEFRNGVLKPLEDVNLEQLIYENSQIELFVKSIEGFDCSNIYSDLIYNKLFGLNTMELRDRYKTGKYESFRKYLTDEMIKNIEDLERIIGSLINLGWNYGEIERFVAQKL